MSKQKSVPIDGKVKHMLQELCRGYGNTHRTAERLRVTTRTIMSWIGGSTKCMGIRPYNRLVNAFAKHMKDRAPGDGLYHYNDRVWLNPENSSSSGSIVCYDGLASWGSREGGRERDSFVEVADCHCKARVHICRYDTHEDYLAKVRNMRQALQRYEAHLEAVLDIKLAEEAAKKENKDNG